MQVDFYEFKPTLHWHLFALQNDRDLTHLECATTIRRGIQSRLRPIVSEQKEQYKQVLKKSVGGTATR